MAATHRGSDSLFWRPQGHVKYLLALACASLASHCWSQLVVADPPEMRGIDIKEHLGEAIPRELSFIDESGTSVKLGDLLSKGKPLVLTLAYYECPMLCTLVLNGLGKAVQKLDWRPGSEYQMLTVSIDPGESPELAKAKRDRYVADIGKGNIGDGWQFWVSPDNQVKALADALGFHYFYDEKRDEYAHSATVFVITENGVISRYLYGLDYERQDLKLALLEASEGKVGSIIDRIVMYCYHYDPQGGKYVLMAANIMRLGGVATVLGLGALLGTLWIRERKNVA